VFDIVVTHALDHDEVLRLNPEVAANGEKISQGDVLKLPPPPKVDAFLREPKPATFEPGARHVFVPTFRPEEGTPPRRSPPPPPEPVAVAPPRSLEPSAPAEISAPTSNLPSSSSSSSSSSSRDDEDKAGDDWLGAERRREVREQLSIAQGLGKMVSDFGRATGSTFVESLEDLERDTAGMDKRRERPTPSREMTRRRATTPPPTARPIEPTPTPTPTPLAPPAAAPAPSLAPAPVVAPAPPPVVAPVAPPPTAPTAREAPNEDDVAAAAADAERAKAQAAAAALAVEKAAAEKASKLLAEAELAALRKAKLAEEKATKAAIAAADEVRPMHWFPYDPVRVVNAGP